MERAQRAADSPLRAILEASKSKRSVGGEEAEAAKRPVAVVPRPPGLAASGAVRAEAPRAAVLAQVPAAVAVPALAPNAVPGAAAGAVAAPPPEAPIRTLPTQAALTAPKRSAALETAVAPVPAGATAGATRELPRVVTTPLPQPAYGKLELVRMVEPELTPRMLEMLSRPEVSVEFLIRPDGSVTDVRVLPPVPRLVVAPIVAAVEQWRFAPLLVSREHRVKLVFTDR